MPARYEVFRDAAGGWRWRLVAKNGEIVAQSESYSSKRHAERAVADVKATSDAAKSVELDGS